MALRVETQMGASTVAGVVAVVLVAGLVAVPFFASRGTIQDLLFILSMLVLAQFWNLLAGYGGLVSVGPQAFVGIGACAMFGAAILWGWDQVLALALCVATVGGIYWLLRTRRGLALAAVRDNVEAAKAVGVDAGRMKGVVFLAAIPADPAAGLLRVMGAILGRDRWKRGISPKRIRPRLSSRAVRRRKMRGWPR